MFSEGGQWKRQSPPPVLLSSEETLEIYLKKKIKVIMAKEWWDFIINGSIVKNDHASLLYSIANICPSFNYFLQTKEQELHEIIKMRPVVKPRIFCGSERPNITPEPIVPKQLPLVTKRNSANELTRILNDLYPCDNPVKRQSRTYGPASKQRKLLSPNKKNLSAAVVAENSGRGKTNESFGQTPFLSKLLADESQKENAHVLEKKLQPPLSMPVLSENNSDLQKNILSNNYCDLTQNKINQPHKKRKKVTKIKKKRYLVSNTSVDSKCRKRFILEDESTDLNIKQIKKYRIKKCNVNVVRLDENIIKQYNEINSVNNISSVENLTVNERSDITERSDTHCGSVDLAASALNEKSNQVQEKNTSHLVLKELKTIYLHGGLVPLGKHNNNEKVFDIINENLDISLITKSNSKTEEIKKIDLNSNSSEVQSNNKPSPTSDWPNESDIEKLLTDNVPDLNIMKQTNLPDETTSSLLDNGNISGNNKDLSQNKNAIMNSCEKSDLKLTELSVCDVDTHCNKEEKLNGSKPSESITETLNAVPQLKMFKGISVKNTTDTKIDENVLDYEDHNIKRAKMQSSLSQMNLEISNKVEFVTNDVQTCKICKKKFDTEEVWKEHFENEVPKCSPNLTITWDIPKVLSN